MKSALIHIAIGLSAFFGGVACAIYFSMQIEGELDRQFDLAQFSPDFAPEIDVAMNLHQIKAAQEGNVEWIILYNCFQLSHKLKLINPLEFEGQRREEVETLSQRAYEKFRELDSQGLCGTTQAKESN